MNSNKIQYFHIGATLQTVYAGNTLKYFYVVHIARQKHWAVFEPKRAQHHGKSLQKMK